MVFHTKLSLDKIILFIADFDKKTKKFVIKSDLKGKDMDIHHLYSNTEL